MTWHREGARLALRLVDGQELASRVRYCGTLWSLARGLTFRRRLRAGEGVLLAFPTPAWARAGLHMHFVFCPLGIVWLAETETAHLSVVGTTLALPWRSGYVPPGPAHYALEAAPEIVRWVGPGDRVEVILT